MSKPESVAAILDAAPVKPSDAISFVRQKTLVTTARFGELEQEAHARAFTSAGMTEERMLARVAASVQRAISDGTGFAEFQKQFLKTAKDFDWRPNVVHGDVSAALRNRANLIYDTNMSMAFSAGEWARLNTPEAIDIYPWFQYRHHACQHPRAQHVAWDGLILPRDDPFWTTHWPPNGWRCHCTVEPVSRRDMRRNNWSVSESPPIQLVEKRNPATGKIVQVPKGIDLGFAYNPGRVWQDDVAARAASAPRPLSHVGGIPKENVPPAVRERAQVEQIEELLDKRAGSVEAGTLPDAVAKELDVADTSVILDADTMGKQGFHHSEAEREEYLAIPSMLARPLAVTRGTPTPAGQTVVLIGRHGKQFYSLAVARTGAVATLKNIYAIGQKTARRLARNRLLWGSLDDVAED